MNEKIITLKNLGKFAEWIKDKFENKADRSEIPTTLPADGGNADTVGGKSAEELIQSNPNLLLNPDFKINQRGRTEYSGYTSTVDRWEKTTAGVVTIDSDGVTLNNTGGTAAMYWGQVLSLNLANVPVSLSACDSDGNIYSISGIAPEKSKNPLKLLISDIGSFYVDLNVDHYEFFFQVKAGKSIKIKWAKLEYGHIVTSFIPPNPIEEALKCGSLKNAEQQLFYGNGKWAECPPNPNLLDNPDFKINQRGKSEYGYDGSDRYTVDRWKLQANLTLTVHSDYVTVSRHDPTSNSHTGFRQDLNISDDTLVTLQACVKGNGSFTLFHNGFNGTAEIQVQDTDGWVVVKCTGYGASEVGILLRGTATSLDIKWIKLELGAVSTPFVPPNPIEEALKCGAIEEPAQQILYGNGTWATAPSNPNLLDNPDFKINQRGQSEYTGITYTVDRWRTFDSKSKIQVVNSGIKITTLTAANENENTNPLFQIFDRPVDIYNGKQFTLSLKAINITGPWRVCIRFGKSFPSGDYVTATYRTISSGINHWTFTVPDQAVSMRIGIVQYGPDGSAIGDTITIEWIKLELGAVATPFVPPNGAEELLKCQKYCLTLTTDICRNYTMNTNSLWFLIPTATRLRLSPSASDISKLKVKVYGTGTIYDDFTYQIGVKSYPPAIIVEAQKANHGINTNVGGVLTVPTGMLILSADL